MPLVGLEDIEWDKLHHAYGSARDVPDLLRALDEAATSEAFYQLSYELWNHINHQGDHYSVTPVCVPFLFQILKSKQQIEQKLDVLISLGELLRTLRHDANKNLILDEAEESKSYFVISSELEYLLRLFTVDNFELRMGSLYVLSFLHHEAEQLLPILSDSIQTASESRFEASAIWVYSQFMKALPLSERTKGLVQLKKWIDSPSPLVRYAAAWGYLSISVPLNIPDNIIKLVVQGMTIEDWSLEESSSKALRHLFAEMMPFLNARWLKANSDLRAKMLKPLNPNLEE